MKKTLKWLDEHFEEYIMITLMAIMVIVMGVQVFMRYVMKNSLAWPEEFTRYIYIWFVFLGMSYGVRNNLHIRVDLLEVLIPKSKKALGFLQDILFLGFCGYMIGPGINSIKLLIESAQTSPAMLIPMYYVYLSLLVGLILSVVRMIQKYVLRIMHYKKGVE